MKANQNFIMAVSWMVVALFTAVPAMAWEGTVTRVLDGDSLRVRLGDEIVTIRLYGIDCPEYGQDFWKEAKEATTVLLLGKRVMVEPVEMDRFDRVVALVKVRGLLASRELVRRGVAWVYPHYCKALPLCRELEDLERVARVQRIGLWRERQPTPPWIWKHPRS